MQNNQIMKSTYDRESIAFMWKELEAIGIKPLTSGQEVNDFLAEKSGTKLVVINSVCGCAAGNARPGVALALQNKVIPDKLATVFAGVDKEAVHIMRENISDFPPSSPSIALFKDGEIVYMLQRTDIEGFSMENVASRLTDAFNQHCSSEGPSVSADKVKEVFSFTDSHICGSSLKVDTEED